MSPLEAESGSVKFDLSMVMEERAGAGGIPLTTSISLTRGRRAFVEFCGAVEAIVAGRSSPSRNWRCCVLAEQAQLLAQGNQSRAAFPDSQAVHSLFEAVERTRKRWRWCLPSSS